MTRLLGARVWGEDTPRDVEIPGDDVVLDARGHVLIPSAVDLCCDPGFPGFPVREDLSSLGAAALAGGFADLLVSPHVDPVVDTPEQVAQVPRQAPGGARLWPAAAQTQGLHGKELAEIGLMAAAGARCLSDGAVPVRDTVVMRNALEYARGFGLLTMLRPADADLDALGVVHEGPLAGRIGLRGNPAAGEEIGITRVLALARATGARVHLTHVGTGRGVAMIRAARAEGLPVTASTPARSLVLDEEALESGGYETRYRLRPPLRAASDREALVAGVRDGTLLLVADHAPRAPEEKDLEFELAVPGSTGLESALSASLAALGDLDAVVRALCVGPRALLGLPAIGMALVDPGAAGVVAAAGHRSRARNDALEGRTLAGRVVACFPVAAWAGTTRWAC